jgi:hypothetical protein
LTVSIFFSLSCGCNQEKNEPLLLLFFFGVDRDGWLPVALRGFGFGSLLSAHGINVFFVVDQALFAPFETRSQMLGPVDLVLVDEVSPGTWILGNDGRVGSSSQDFCRSEMFTVALPASRLSLLSVRGFRVSVLRLSSARTTTPASRQKPHNPMHATCNLLTTTGSFAAVPKELGTQRLAFGRNAAKLRVAECRKKGRQRPDEILPTQGVRLLANGHVRGCTNDVRCAAIGAANGQDRP